MKNERLAAQSALAATGSTVKSNRAATTSRGSGVVAIKRQSRVRTLTDTELTTLAFAQAQALGLSCVALAKSKGAAQAPLQATKARGGKGL